MHLTYVKRQSDITYINEAFDLLNFSSIDLCSLLVNWGESAFGEVVEGSLGECILKDKKSRLFKGPPSKGEYMNIYNFACIF